MSLKDFVRSGGRKRPGPVCYEIPLSAIAEQLPFELMKTGMWWIWRSSRQADHTPYCDSALPDKRTPTLLTPDSAAAFAAEFAEHDDEFSRWMLVVGGNGSPPGVLLSAAQMQGEIEGFSQAANTSLEAIIFQIGDSPNEEFVVGSVPSPTAMTLLESLAERVGTRLDRLRTTPGRGVLDRVLNGIRAEEAHMPDQPFTGGYPNRG